MRAPRPIDHGNATYGFVAFAVCEGAGVYVEIRWNRCLLLHIVAAAAECCYMHTSLISISTPYPNQSRSTVRFRLLPGIGQAPIGSVRVEYHVGQRS